MTSFRGAAALICAAVPCCGFSVIPESMKVKSKKSFASLWGGCGVHGGAVDTSQPKAEKHRPSRQARLRAPAGFQRQSLWSLAKQAKQA